MIIIAIAGSVPEAKAGAVPEAVSRSYVPGVAERAAAANHAARTLGGAMRIVVGA